MITLCGLDGIFAVSIIHLETHGIQNHCCLICARICGFTFYWLNYHFWLNATSIHFSFFFVANQFKLVNKNLIKYEWQLKQKKNVLCYKKSRFVSIILENRWTVVEMVWISRELLNVSMDEIRRTKQNNPVLCKY